jgi:hypothetical protein
MPRLTIEQAIRAELAKAIAAKAVHVKQRDALYLRRKALQEQIEAVVAKLRGAIDRESRAKDALAAITRKEATDESPAEGPEAPAPADASNEVQPDREDAKK